MSIELFISTAIFTLITMIYFHIREDFNQGEFLSKYKQRANWLKDEIGKDDKYKNDYKACLLIHSFKWSFTIMIPLFVFMLIMDSAGVKIAPIPMSIIISSYLIANTAIHYKVDDLKANKLSINLITDQMVHLLQIFGVWLPIFTIYLSELLSKMKWRG